MRRFVFFLVCFSLFLFDCNYPQEKKSEADSIPAAVVRDPLSEEDYSDEGEFYENLSCDDLENKSVIYHLASENRFLELEDYDTSAVLILRGHFISADSISTLIMLPGMSGPPCGTGCNLLLLYTCGSVARFAYSDNTGSFTAKDVKDLDADGIPEIFTEYGMMRMGECSDYTIIYNLKGGKRNTLYEGYSHSSIGCGFGDMNAASFHKGDTLGVEIKSELIDSDKDGVFEVKEIREFKICNGGTTEKEIMDRQIVRIDSTFVPLKKIKVK